MAWDLNSERPIYAQIIEKVMFDIVSGHYKPGEKLPSVRDLASEASVNPNTMQKALSELENSGLVYSQRTSGRFITEDNSMIQNAQKELAKAEITQFMQKMDNLGLTREETIALIQSGKEKTT